MLLTKQARNKLIKCQYSIDYRLIQVMGGNKNVNCCYIELKIGLIYVSTNLAILNTTYILICRARHYMLYKTSKANNLFKLINLLQKTQV